jgi:hypothetical protein
MNVVFPTVDQVLEIHMLSLARYGGADGIREPSLLESALAQPQAVFGGQFLSYFRPIPERLRDTRLQRRERAHKGDAAKTRLCRGFCNLEYA